MKANINCSYCGKSFEASSLKKMYCSGTCRNYASLQKKGQLPISQINYRSKMASISGIQTAAESEQIFTRPVKLLTEFLSGQFVHYVNRKGEYEPDMMGLNDDEERNYGVERVITTMNGDFILTSLYERDIDNFIKKEFPTTTLDISKFSGVTQEITDDEYDGGYYYRRRTFKIFITYEIALELFKKKVPNVRALFINESKTQKLKQS